MACMSQTDCNVMGSLAMTTSARTLRVCLGALERSTGIFLDLKAVSYKDLVKMLPTALAKNTFNIIGINKLIDDVVSSMITTSE